MTASRMTCENRQRIKEASALRSPFICCLACLKKTFFSKRGQQVMEYAILVSVLSSALIVMYVYTKRGLQNVLKISADQIGPQGDSAPLSSVSMHENTTSTAETLTDEATQVDRIGREQTITMRSDSITTGISTTWSEERVE